MNSCQWLDLISILNSVCFDLNISLPSSPLQPLEAGQEVESSQQGVLTAYRWKNERVIFFFFFNTLEILTDDSMKTVLPRSRLFDKNIYLDEFIKIKRSSE